MEYCNQKYYFVLLKRCIQFFILFMAERVSETTSGKGINCRLSFWVQSKIHRIQNIIKVLQNKSINNIFMTDKIKWKKVWHNCFSVDICSARCFFTHFNSREYSIVVLQFVLYICGACTPISISFKQHNFLPDDIFSNYLDFSSVMHAQLCVF